MKHHKKAVNCITILSISIFLAQLYGCTQYYLQKVNTSFTIPDNAPVPVVERARGQTRLSLGLSANPRSEITFNDGNHYDSVTYSSTGWADTLNYDGKNVKLHVPSVQGSLLVDFTISNHFFIAWKSNFGYSDGHYSGTCYIDPGLQFTRDKSVFSFYFAPGVYTLNSDAQIRKSDYDTDSIYSYSLKNDINFTLGGGIQFSTKFIEPKWNFAGGIEIQGQRYFTFLTDDKNRKNYHLYFFTPSMELFRTFGLSQVNCKMIFPIPFQFDGEDDSPHLFIDMIMPVLHVSYTYCFGSDKSK